ncbi:MAG: translocation/assembly module TamB domain-containing protein [Pseudohongiellaceae bacterium]|nr:translocation/assembly module TamB domain-containing protein [Pseudohongiellaceae bacterium]
MIAPPASMKKSLLKVSVITLSIVLILLLLTVVGFALLIGTTPGSQWLVAKGINAFNTSQTQIRYKELQGNLVWGLDIHDLEINSPTLRIDANRATASWQPFPLLFGRLHIDRLSVDKLAISSRQQDQHDLVSSQAEVNIPFAIFLDDLRIDSLKLSNQDSELMIDSVRLSAQLEDQQLSLSSLHVQHTDARLQGSAELSLANLIFAADLEWQYTAIPQTLDLESAQGHLIITGDMSQLSFEHEFRAPFSIRSTGSVQISPELLIEAEHILQEQSLPLPNTAELRVRLLQSRFNTSGSLASLSVSGQSGIGVSSPTSTFAPLDFALSWDSLVRQDSIALNEIDLSSSTGAISATGEINWQNQLQTQLGFTVRENSLANYEQLLGSTIDLRQISSAGQITANLGDDGWRSSITLDAFSAILSDYPVSARASARLSPEGVIVDSLEIDSAKQKLELSGAWSDTIELNWHLQSNSLTDLNSALSGAVSSTGTVTGSLAAPRINATAQGKNLAFGDYKIEALSLSGSYQDAQNTIALSLIDAQLGQLLLDEATMDLNGLVGSHEATLSATHDTEQLTLTLTGGAYEQNETWQWEGNISAAAMQSYYGNWELNQAPALTASLTRASLERLCMSRDTLSICVEGNWQNDDDIDAQLNMEGFDLAQFNALSAGGSELPLALPHFSDNASIAGSLSATVSVSAPANLALDQLSLDAKIDAGSGRLILTRPSASEDEQDSTSTMQWQDATLTASLDQAQWLLKTSVSITQEDLADTGLSMQGQVNGQLTIDADRQLDGQLYTTLEDLSWLQAFNSDVQQVQGRLTSELDINGSVQAPAASGTITAHEVGFEIPTLGIRLFDINASLNGTDSGNFSLTGEAKSGSGSLQFSSNINTPFSSERNIHASITGDNFELINVEDLTLSLSPDVSAQFVDNTLDIRGLIQIPHVDLRLDALPESTVTVSPDAVIVSQPQQQVRNAATSEFNILQELNITSELRVELGDSAHFSGFGLTTELEGALDMSRNTNGSLLSYGELRVAQGYYRTYGKTLEIEHGKLLFFGSLNNPALDIRATRSSNSTKVGVQMNGTLRNIRSQLFSTPSLPDSDIIAIMLTDRPFSEIGQQDSNALLGAVANLGIRQSQSLTTDIREQLGLDTLALSTGGASNNSSLTLGKYLTPDLFVRYGLGLFDTESTVSLEYSVSERVKIEATSGNSQSVDINYTVER